MDQETPMPTKEWEECHVPDIFLVRGKVTTSDLSTRTGSIVKADKERGGITFTRTPETKTDQVLAVISQIRVEVPTALIEWK